MPKDVRRRSRRALASMILVLGVYVLALTAYPGKATARPETIQQLPGEASGGWDSKPDWWGAAEKYHLETHTEPFTTGSYGHIFATELRILVFSILRWV